MLQKTLHVCNISLFKRQLTINSFVNYSIFNIKRNHINIPNFSSQRAIAFSLCTLTSSKNVHFRVQINLLRLKSKRFQWKIYSSKSITHKFLPQFLLQQSIVTEKKQQPLPPQCNTSIEATFIFNSKLYQQTNRSIKTYNTCPTNPIRYYIFLNLKIRQICKKLFITLNNLIFFQQKFLDKHCILIYS
eukprot:TRINITY_DN16142_c0_g1_i1.p1 TRINITY_DN16142_c0_g1~~TRINITY_DN16142_c0_g1_i1.p1  ORF type:complete len:197 (-),score=-10.51 TRINITY_DN16142_c0_g1_i1:106-669(-)